MPFGQQKREYHFYIDLFNIVILRKKRQSTQPTLSSSSLEYQPNELAFL